MEPNHIYQFSLLNALMDGVCSTGITAETLLRKGTIGLGTFVRMDGELIFLDNKIYQMQPGGRIREVEPLEQIPFAVSTHFVPQRTDRVQLNDKTAIDAVMEKYFPNARNLFLTYRMKGRFEYLKCRTVRGQEYAGQPLSELGKKQSVEEYHNISGDVVGFATPPNWQGFNVAGQHLHFIDDERKKGGHVLEIRANEVEMQMAVASNVHLELPTSDEFNTARLETDDIGVKAVEG